jgi:plasmid stabilization system protein ParE
MRRVVLTDEAASQLESQIDYLLDKNAEAAARALRLRVSQFIGDTLATYPASGKFIAEQDLWESWIPGTRLVAWYKFDEDVLTLITFWHTSRDRAR